MTSVFQISLRVRSLLPHATAIIVDAFRRRRERHLSAIGILLLASSVVHPISLAGQAPISYDGRRFFTGLTGPLARGSLSQPPAL